VRSGAQPTATTSVDWPQFHDTIDRVGNNTQESTLDTSNVGGLQLRWRAFLNSTGAYSGSSPVIVGGTAYVGSDDGAVYALQASDGSQVWRYQTGAKVDSSPAVVGGVVYFGSDDDKVYALNATNGSLIWSYTTGGAVNSPALVANGIVYISSMDGHFYALNASNGSLVWGSGYLWQTWEGGALANGVVYVASDESMLWAFDATTGATRWTATLGGMGRSNPTVSGGIVYAGADDGRLYAFDATTGALKWKTPVLGTSTPCIVRSSPAVANGLVYVTTSEGVTAGTGSQTPNGHLYAFNATTGAQVWSHTLPDMSGFSPVVANGVVYSSGYGHNAYAYNATTGTQLWNAGFGLFLGNTGGGALDNGNFYFLNVDGYLYDYADLTPPTITFDSKPPASTNLSTASFSWHATEDLSGGFTCQLDAVPVACPTPSISLAGLLAGAHSFSVSATDLSGNTGTGTYSWTVDTTPPDVSIIKHPNAASTTSSAQFKLSSSDSTASFLCQLDSQAQQPCSAWDTYTLADGNHTFKAWAKDPAGNVSPVPTTFSWVIDTDAPVVTVTGPSSIKLGQAAVYTQTSSEPVTWYCSKDGATYKLCPAPTSWKPTTTGAHTIKFYGIDQAVWIQSNIVTLTLTVN